MYDLPDIQPRKRRISEPVVTPDEIMDEAERQEVDPLLAVSIAKAENAGRNSTSPKGARGPMQVMPATARRIARELGETYDPNDIQQNIRFGVYEAGRLDKKYRGDKTKAVAAYNAGEGAVNRYGGIPPYRETQNYTRKVNRTYNALAELPEIRRRVGKTAPAAIEPESKTTLEPLPAASVVATEAAPNDSLNPQLPTIAVPVQKVELPNVPEAAKSLPDKRGTKAKPAAYQPKDAQEAAVLTQAKLIGAVNQLRKQAPGYRKVLDGLEREIVGGFKSVMAAPETSDLSGTVTRLQKKINAAVQAINVDAARKRRVQQQRSSATGQSQTGSSPRFDFSNYSKAEADKMQANEPTDRAKAAFKSRLSAPKSIQVGPSPPADVKAPTWGQQAMQNVLDTVDPDAGAVPDVSMLLDEGKGVVDQAREFAKLPGGWSKLPNEVLKGLDKAAVSLPQGAASLVDTATRGLVNATPARWILDAGGIRLPVLAEALQGWTQSAEADIDRQYQERYGIDPNVKSKAGVVGGSIGGSVPLLMGGVTGAGTKGVALLGAMMNAQQVYSEARRKGATAEQAAAAAKWAGPIGALEGAFGAEAQLAKMGVSKTLARKASAVVLQMPGEIGQEWLTGLLNNVNAKFVSGYDNERKVLDGMVESAIGAIGMTASLGGAGLIIQKAVGDKLGAVNNLSPEELQSAADVTAMRVAQQPEVQQAAKAAYSARQNVEDTLARIEENQKRWKRGEVVAGADPQVQLADAQARAQVAEQQLDEAVTAAMEPPTKDIAQLSETQKLAALTTEQIKNGKTLTPIPADVTLDQAKEIYRQRVQDFGTDSVAAAEAWQKVRELSPEVQLQAGKDQFYAMPEADALLNRLGNEIGSSKGIKEIDAFLRKHKIIGVTAEDIAGDYLTKEQAEADDLNAEFEKMGLPTDGRAVQGGKYTAVAPETTGTPDTGGRVIDLEADLEAERKRLAEVAEGKRKADQQEAAMLAELEQQAAQRAEAKAQADQAEKIRLAELEKTEKETQKLRAKQDEAQRVADEKRTILEESQSLVNQQRQRYTEALAQNDYAGAARSLKQIEAQIKFQLREKPTTPQEAALYAEREADLEDLQRELQRLQKLQTTDTDNGKPAKPSGPLFSQMASDPDYIAQQQRMDNVEADRRWTNLAEESRNRKLTDEEKVALKSPIEYLKHATKGEGIKVGTSGERAMLGAKESGIVGLTNQRSRFSTADAQVMLDEGGFVLPDGRRFTDSSVTENDVVDFLIESGKTARSEMADVDAQMAEEEAAYYAKLEEEASANRDTVPDYEQPNIDTELTDFDQAGRGREAVDGDIPGRNIESGRNDRSATPSQPSPGVGAGVGRAPVAGAPAVSPFVRLRDANAERLSRLREVTAASPEGRALVGELRDYAKANGIEQRHVDALVADVINEEFAAAQEADRNARQILGDAKYTEYSERIDNAEEEFNKLADRIARGFEDKGVTRQFLAAAARAGFTEAEGYEILRRAREIARRSKTSAARAKKAMDSRRARGRRANWEAENQRLTDTYGGRLRTAIGLEVDVRITSRTGRNQVMVELADPELGVFDRFVTSEHYLDAGLLGRMGLSAPARLDNLQSKSDYDLSRAVSELNQLLAHTFEDLRALRAAGDLRAVDNLEQVVIPMLRQSLDEGRAEMIQRGLLKEAAEEERKAKGDFSKKKLTELFQADLARKQAEIDLAAHEAATSPTNERPEPTDGQKEAGNYKKGSVTLHGLTISIENPTGSKRSGVDPDGKPWEVEMTAHYGYIRRTEGADGEQVDVYIGDNPESEKVFVVDQIDAETKAFDEHKVILNVPDRASAEALYDSHFSDGKGAERRAAVTEMTLPEFKDWLKSGDTTKPIAKASEKSVGDIFDEEFDAMFGEKKPEAPAANPTRQKIETLFTEARARFPYNLPVQLSVVLRDMHDEAPHNSADSDAVGAFFKEQFPDESEMIDYTVNYYKQTQAAKEAAISATDRAVFDKAWGKRVDGYKHKDIIAQFDHMSHAPAEKINAMRAWFLEKRPDLAEVINQQADNLTEDLPNEAQVEDAQVQQEPAGNLNQHVRFTEGDLRAVQQQMEAIDKRKNLLRDPHERMQLQIAYENLAKQESAIFIALQAQRAERTSPLVNAIVERLRTGEPFQSITEARKWAEETTGQPYKPGTTAAKELDEAIEFAGVQAARQTIAELRANGVANEVIFDAINAIAEKMPNLNVRTSTSIEQQAYSTPLALAFAASRLAGIDARTTVYEPTAGNGALLVEANPARTFANELNPDRANNLRNSLDAARVTEGDAMNVHLPEQVDVVIANPPFGTVKDDAGKSKTFTLTVGGKEMETTEIDHAIAFKALAAMKPDGRAVLIVGGVRGEGDVRRDKYNVGAKKRFYYRLYKNYNVVDHFTVDGALYAKQGAAYPVDVIVIEGRGESKLPLPAKVAPEILESYDAIKAKISTARRVDAETQPTAGSNPNPPRPATGQQSIFDLPIESDQQNDSGIGANGNAGFAEPTGSSGTAGSISAANGGSTNPGQRGATQSPVQPGSNASSANRPGKQSGSGKANQRNDAGSVAQRPDRSGGRASDVVDAAGSAAVNTIKGLDDIAMGLSQLFGDPSQTNSGPAFNEDTYKKAKVYFEAAVAHFKEAAGDVRAVVRNLMEALRDKYNFTKEMIANMKPYIVRFVEEYDAKPQQAPATTPKAEPIRTPGLDYDALKNKAKKAKAGAQASETHRPYVPASGGYRLNTLVPANLSTGTQAALTRLREQVGEIDAYVEQKLAYEPGTLSKYLSAEQADAVALAISNLEAGRGYVIGDQTGIGKGRVNAAIIAYAIESGRTPIFVTEKPKLYGDMLRDLKDIGREGVQPVMTNAGEEIPINDAAFAWYDAKEVAIENGERVPDRPPDAKFLKTKDPKSMEAELQKLMNDPASLGQRVIFTTYAQMQTLKGKETQRMRFLEQFARRGSLLILDESHNAGGGKKQTDADTGEVKMDRAQFVRKLIRLSSGTFYSSATFAKRPEVMDLYSRTDLSQLGNQAELEEMFEKGGIPLQQVVSAMLVESGQMSRRERSFEGIEYNTTPTDVDLDTAENISHSIQRILDFSEHVKAVVAAISEGIRGEGAADVDSSVGQAGADSTNFTSIMHNLVGQMLLALKADAAADMAIRELEAGRKPIITVANTMGSFIEKYVTDNQIAQGEEINLSFRDLLLRYLERSREYREKDADGNSETIVLSDEQLGSHGVRLYEEALEFIQEAEFNLPISPIDHLHMRLREAGYRTGEITGRMHTISHDAGYPAYRIRPARETSTAAKAVTLNRFNEGDLDVLILNQSGSTGLSAHASEKYHDQRQRVMVIAQAEANIDTHMQMLGRINRTGQMVLPIYYQLAANIPAEMRPAAVLAKKMASLNANTTGARSSAVTAKETIDFVNKYGDEAAVMLVTDNSDLNAKLGFPLATDEDGKLKTENAVARLTGRLAALPIAEQEKVYEELTAHYKEILEQAEAMGENTLEAKTLNLEAEPLSTIVAEPARGSSPFQKEVLIEKAMVNVIGKPMKLAEVKQEIHRALNITEDREISAASSAHVAAIKARVAEHSTAAIPKLEAQLEQLRANRDALPADADLKVVEKAHKLVDAKVREIAAAKIRGEEYRNVINRVLNTAHIGAGLEIATKNGIQYGVVIGISSPNKLQGFGLSSWKLTVATTDSSRLLKMPFSQIAVGDGSATFRINKASYASVYTADSDQAQSVKMLEAFDMAGSIARERRYLVTGNVPRAFVKFPQGRIISFTDKDGKIRQGLLMPRGWDAKKAITSQDLQLSESQVLQYLNYLKARIVDSDKRLEITRHSNQRDYLLTVPAAKATGAKYYLNPGLRDLVGDFVKSGSKMVVRINDVSVLQKALQYLQTTGLQGEPVSFYAGDPKHARAALGLKEAAETAVNQVRSSRSEQGYARVDMFVPQFAVDGLRYIFEGGRKFAQWAAPHLKEFGAKVRPVLRKAWEEAKKFYKDERGILNLQKLQQFVARTPAPVPVNFNPAKFSAAVVTAVNGSNLSQKKKQAALDAYNAAMTAVGNNDGAAFKKAQIELKHALGKFGIGLLDITRPMMAGGELSIIGRQGGYHFLAHPVLSGQALLTGFQSVSERGYHETLAELEAHPYFEKAKKAGVDFGVTSEFEIDKSTLAGEENFSVGLAGRIPVLKHLERINKAFLDMQRLKVFAHGAEMIEQAGGTPEEVAAGQKEWAKEVNRASGRGNIKEKYREAVGVASMGLFSPRFAISRLQLLDLTRFVRAYRKNPAAAKMMMADAVKLVGAFGALTGLAFLSGATVGGDPDDADFLKMQIGNVHFSLVPFGLGSYVKIGARMIKRAVRYQSTGDEREIAKGQKQLMSFGRMKLAPLPGLVVDQLDQRREKGEVDTVGHNAIGEPKTLRESITDRLWPMFYQNIAETAAKEGLFNAVMKNAPEFLGADSQVYDEKEFIGRPADTKYDKNILSAPEKRTARQRVKTEIENLPAYKELPDIFRREMMERLMDAEIADDERRKQRLPARSAEHRRLDLRAEARAADGLKQLYDLPEIKPLKSEQKKAAERAYYETLEPLRGRRASERNEESLPDLPTGADIREALRAGLRAALRPSPATK